MSKNGLKIYSVIITLAAAALLVAVVLLAVKDSEKKEAPEETSSAMAIGESTSEEESLVTEISSMISEDDNDPGNGTEEEPEAGSLYNVSGEVEWEAGNNDSQNIINAWTNMLKQLDYDADIAFLGDSITVRGDLNIYFPDKKVINLGCGGDTIRGVYNRSEMLSYVSAETVVVMCGVNMLRDDNIEFCTAEYAGLLDSVKNYAPDAQILVCSILPMSKLWQDMYCMHETTEEFNLVIEELASKRDMIYLNLYPLFEEAGEIKPEYTFDGVHLTPSGYDVWMKAIYEYVYR